MKQVYTVKFTSDKEKDDHGTFDGFVDTLINLTNGHTAYEALIMWPRKEDNDVPITKT